MQILDLREVVELPESAIHSPTWILMNLWIGDSGFEPVVDNSATSPITLTSFPGWFFKLIDYWRKNE